eukprot:jgi/Undpi1/1178/HiC_scaffold_10.g04640.m1
MKNEGCGFPHSEEEKEEVRVICCAKVDGLPPRRPQQLSVGGHHACGLRREGQVVCWGDDIAKSTSGVPENTVFVQVVAGKDNSCGLRPNGQAVCWGSNIAGQSEPPKDVQFRQLSASSSRHVCGLTLEGDIRCWGRDMRGETQFRVGPWAQVTCGQWTTCGIRQHDGGIECWGMNKLNSSRSSYEEVTTADYHTCAVNWNGEVECWGNAQKAEQVPDGFQAA